MYAFFERMVVKQPVLRARGQYHIIRKKRKRRRR
jgi:hypothetical protein